MTTYAINPEFIPLLDNDSVEVMEKITVHKPFEFGVGPMKYENVGRPDQFPEIEESNILWNRTEGLVITRVKYFAIHKAVA